MQMVPIYTVNYAIVVNNVGGATGSYSEGIPLQFDNDVTISSGKFTQWSCKIGSNEHKWQHNIGNQCNYSKRERPIHTM